MSLISMLNDTCNVYRITTTQNDFGEEVKAENLQFSNLKCRVVAGSLSEIIENGVLRVAKKPYKVFLEPTNEILRLDTIEVNGDKLEVLNAKKDSSNNHYEIEAQLITG